MRQPIKMQKSRKRKKETQRKEEEERSIKDHHAPVENTKMLLFSKCRTKRNNEEKLRIKVGK